MYCWQAQIAGERSSVQQIEDLHLCELAIALPLHDACNGVVSPMQVPRCNFNASVFNVL